MTTEQIKQLLIRNSARHAETVASERSEAAEQFAENAKVSNQTARQSIGGLLLMLLATGLPIELWQESNAEVVVSFIGDCPEDFSQFRGPDLQTALAKAVEGMG